MLSNVNIFLNFEKLFLKKFVNITFILSQRNVARIRWELKLEIIVYEYDSVIVSYKHENVRCCRYRFRISLKRWFGIIFNLLFWNLFKVFCLESFSIR